MTKKTKQRVHFKPSHFKHHPIMGKVAVYYWSSKNACTAEGCSATFYLNGAEPDNPNHFAIKMFNTSIEAYAAFERQSLAAKDGLAPPVGHMAQFVYKMRNGRYRNRWGYTTCVARTDERSRDKAFILSSPAITKLFNDFCDAHGLSVEFGDNLNRGSVFAFIEHLNSGYNEGQHNFSPSSMANDVVTDGSLIDLLSQIDISCTQYDNLMEEDWGNDRLTLGSVYLESDEVSMCNDLHMGNIGLWQGKTVCIDFGYHIVSSFGDRDCYFSSSCLNDINLKNIA